LRIEFRYLNAVEMKLMKMVEQLVAHFALLS